MKKLGALLAIVVAGIAVGAPASALPYPPAGPTLTLSSSTVAPGGSVLAEFGGCTVGGTVTFAFNGSTVEVTSVDTATGSVASTSLTAPTTPGAYPIVATCVPTSESVTVVLTVVAPAGGGLPATGSDSAPTVQIASGIVAVGVGLATVGGLRRRKRAAA